MKTITEIRDSRFLGSISTSSIRNLLPRSMSTKSPKKTKSNNENTPPVDPNIQVNNGSDEFTKLYSQSKSLTTERQIASSKTQPEVVAPVDLSIQKEIADSGNHCEVTEHSDPAVEVVVRIKPVNEMNQAVKKVSSDTLSVGDRKFTFDSVLDSCSNQEHVFQLVGVPLVKNSLAGYNTAVLSYGQTGSGKTYTMWGPPSAMVEDPSPGSLQGIVPRIFQMLFSEIHQEQDNSEGKQINYQCRCSFLEIYNEQIGDLLDQTQRNLEIRDDPKNGLYVENLTEEYVTSYEDVTQILIKGLSSRKVGATSLNSKSSRSHIVFTFIIESWCKETSSKCFSSSRTSRITLVDLAGPDRNKLEEAGRQCVKEGKNVKKSVSQLGHLVHALTNGLYTGNSKDTLYRDSRLTHLLREPLGGNAKLTLICTISPENKNIGETLSTLRFGQKVRLIKNDPVVNEISEDDVNDLSDQIRQLKEELIRAKSDAHSIRTNNGYFRGRNVRESLNQLRVSLNRSLILPCIDKDDKEEVNVDEDDVRELREEIDKLHSSCEENLRDPSGIRDSVQSSFVSASCCEAELMSEDEVCMEDTEIEEVGLEKPQQEHHKDITGSADESNNSKISSAIDHSFRNSISISTCRQSPLLQEPTFSESPKIGNKQRKSMAFLPTSLASQNNVSESSSFNSDALQQSFRQSEHIRSSLRSSKIFPGATESLAASLHRGLQIIDHHQRNLATDTSSVSFSFEHLALKPCPEVDKANSSIQTLQEERLSTGSSSSLLCSSCRQKLNNDNSNEEAESDLVEAINRKELENICTEQAAKIEQLTQLLEEYKDGREHEIVPFEEPRNLRDHTSRDGNKLLEHSAGEHEPEVIKEKCEINEVQKSRNTTYFDVNEREELLKEIETLKSKLQSNVACSPNKSTDKLKSSLLSQSIQLRKSIDCRNNTEEELEKERQRWTEMESEWICLTDELRIDIETHRRHAEKVEMELKLEKKCTEELDDALHRAVLGHARFVEHYTELQEKYNDLAGKHRAIMEGIAEVKRAAIKAGAKGHGSRFAKSLAAELSVLRVEREREREFLKRENKSLKIQLRDTAEAVHAAGELLVRLREAEQAASAAEENFSTVREENEKLKKQIEKVKRKHKMEMVTMKQYLAESRLPESALKPLYREDSDIRNNSTIPDDDQAWRAEFGATYQEHYY